MHKKVVLLLGLFYVAASAGGFEIDDYLEAVEKVDISDEEYYRYSAGTPRSIKNIKINFTLFKKIELTNSKYFDKPRLDFVGLPDYNGLGYVGAQGDLWFSGIQAGKSTGSVYLKDGGFKEYNSVFEEFPDMDKVFFYQDRWIKLFGSGNAVCAEIDGETISLYDQTEIIPEFIDFSEVGRIYEGKTWWESYIRIEFQGGALARDIALLCYDVFEKEKRVYILPGTSGYTTFGKSAMPVNTTDTRGRIYLGFYFFGPEKIEECPEGSIFILDAERDELFQIRHDIPHRETALAAHYVLGEDGNIYFQVATAEAYYIYRIEPLWEEKMEAAGYEPLFLEMHPELRSLIWGE